MGDVIKNMAEHEEALGESTKFAARVGAETVNYVSNIYKYYVAYKLIAVQKEQSDKAKESLQKKPS